MKKIISLIAIYSTFTVAHLNAQVCFNTLTSFSVDLAPVSIISADFNNDGNLDIATFGNDSISVLIGNGNATFNPAKQFFGGGVNSLYNSNLITSGDFNGDNKIDLASSDNNSNVYVLYGDGLGNFSNAITITVYYPGPIASADLNSDGYSDIALISNGGVCILLGTSSNTLTNTTVYPTSANGSISLNISDYNNDGIKDVATSNIDINNPSISILLGTGTGNFLPATNFSVNINSPFALKSDDFNNDGYVDFAVSGYCGPLIYMGSSMGYSLQISAPVPCSGNWVSLDKTIASGDFNSDGYLDLSVANGAYNDVMILINKGTGEFETPFYYVMGSRLTSITTGDFNNDSKIDFATSVYNASNVSILLNKTSLLPLPTLSITAIPFICEGGADTLTVQGAVDYFWNTYSVSNPSLTVYFSGTYTVAGIDASGCANIKSFTVSDSCDMVWPGDANNDLVVNNNDILAIGIGNTSYRYLRPNATLNWTSQPADNWNSYLINGTNYKHIDCNGDGTIDFNDTVAVIQNFTLTHPAGKINNADNVTTGTPLTIIPQQASIASGSTSALDIILGDVSLPANNIYGLSFTLSFDNTLIDASSIGINGNGTWMGAINNDLLAVSLKTSTYTEFAIVKTNQLNISGQGKIGEITFKTLNNFSSNSSANFSINTVNLISYDETILPVDFSSANTSVTITPISTGISQLSNNNIIKILPNPNNGDFTIVSNVDFDLLIINNLGQTVYSAKLEGVNNFQSIVKNLPSGIYSISATNNYNNLNQKIIVNK